MKQDIDAVLEGWAFQPGGVQARLVRARDGRQVIQLRIDLGVLQLETTNRPDGTRPGDCDTYFEYLRQQARKARRHDRDFVLSEEQCQEADREFVQFYHRRVSWLALKQYAKAIRDADHTLAFMDFARDHSPSDEYTQAHEQYRGFVLFQRTQAAAALEVERDRPEEAINALRAGLAAMRAFFAAFELEEQMEEDGMVQHLRRIEATLREQFNIGATLQEQLAEAVAREDYEQAARLRDQMKEKR